MKLADYNLVIDYKSWKANIVPDALSCRPDFLLSNAEVKSNNTHTLLNPKNVTMILKYMKIVSNKPEIISAQEKDQFVSTVIRDLLENKDSPYSKKGYLPK